jgi:hypothetical protein
MILFFKALFKHALEQRRPSVRYDYRFFKPCVAVKSTLSQFIYDAIQLFSYFDHLIIICKLNFACSQTVFKFVDGTEGEIWVNFDGFEHFSNQIL